MHGVAGKRLLITEWLNPAGISFVGYVGILVFPDVVASPLPEYFEFQLRSSLENQTYLFVAVPILLLGLTLFVRKSWVETIHRNQREIIATLTFSAAALILFLITDSINRYSGYQWLQYLITLYFYFLCICFWGSDKQRAKFSLISAAIAIVVTLASGLVIHGLPEDRYVGLLHPNYFARCAFTAMVIYSIAIRRVRLYAVVLCLIACYIVSSRTILFSSILFYLGYLACSVLHFRITERSWAFLLLACFAIPACMFMLIIFDVNPIIDRVWLDLGFSDLGRGVGSGFSGRADSWQYFFDNMHKMVWFGYGFRSSRYALHYVHSGILSYWMDFGVVLGTALLLGVALKGMSLLRDGVANRDNAAIIAGLSVLTTLLIQFFEPDNFNIGYVGSAFFMLVLAYNSRSSAATSEVRSNSFLNFRLVRH